MNYDEFITELEKVAGKAPKKPKKTTAKPYYYSDASPAFSRYGGLTWYDDELVLFHKYHTGGMSGGNCWDDTRPTGYTIENPESNFEVLDEVLAAIVPNMTLLQYKKLSNKIRTTSYTEGEYYGNSTDYNVKYIEVKILHELIQEIL